MTFELKVYIAGVGSSPLAAGSPMKESIASLVSAATKALLDAGISHDDVSRSVTTMRSDGCSPATEAAKAFDQGTIAIEEVEQGSEFAYSFYLVRNRGARCVLTIAVEKSAAVASVVVSESFLWSHPYLKDSAALVRELDDPQSRSEALAKNGLYDVCQMGMPRQFRLRGVSLIVHLVWTLRGWSKVRNSARLEGRFCYHGKKGECFEFSRADAKSIPEWREIEHRQDGKHRLGYNPAAETREIFREDFEAVRASRKPSKKATDWTLRRKGGDRAALARL